MRLTAVPTMKGSMPMFTMRDTVEGASLVCRVESTRWPVSAALVEISAGFVVADLADQDDVRILAQEGTQSGGEVQDDVASRIWTWLIPIRLNSTGSSAVMMLMSGLLSEASAE